MATQKELDKTYMDMAIAMSKLSKGVRAKFRQPEERIQRSSREAIGYVEEGEETVGQPRLCKKTDGREKQDEN